MAANEYDRTVFINCPFDEQYAPIFEAIVFALRDMGFRPTCARERLDSSEIRLHKIVGLIRQARFSIHDLSRTELDVAHELPRFNMPFELGIDVGCKAFMPRRKNKSILVFDSEKYRFQKYISDIAGQDILHHGNDPRTAILRLRDWLRTESGRTTIPGGTTIFTRYQTFRKELPSICDKLRLDIDALTFVDFSYTVGYWVWPKP